MIVLGIDIGKKADPSAMIEVEGDVGTPYRSVIGCKRLPLGMPYPEQTDIMVELSKGTDLMVVDGNGVGEAVVDALRKSLGGDGPDVWSLIMTGGKTVRCVPGMKIVYIPKKSVVAHLVTCVEHDAISDDVIDTRCNEINQLWSEMKDFERFANGKTEAKVGSHDDLVMALCNALMGFKIQEMVK